MQGCGPWQEHAHFVSGSTCL